MCAQPVDTLGGPSHDRPDASRPGRAAIFPDVPHTGLPLSGLRVIDCTIWQQGTYATAMLGDFGADVIKVEGPDSPDPGRGMAVDRDALNAYFESHNRNKRGVVLDLKHPEGRETLLRLVEGADVFVQNMRQGVMEKLALAYEDLRARNPGIIYASASGYGMRGPQRRWPAMDLLGQARGGTMMAQGPPDLPPIFAFGGMADQVGAIMLSYGILLALWHRARTGEGQQLDASLLGGQIALQSYNISNVLFGEKVPPRRRRAEADALWNVYRCRDDRYIALSMAQGDRWWPHLCAAIGRPDIRDDPRFAGFRERLHNRRDLIRALDEVFAERDQRDWVEYLAGECALPVGPVQDYGQLAADPQVLANDYITAYPYPEHDLRIVGPPVQLEATPGQLRRPAPQFGQHTEEVLLEAGFAWEEIARLKAAGAIGVR